MKRLSDTRRLRHSIQLSIGVTIVCIPYLVYSKLAYWQWKTIALLIITIMLCQVTLVWTPNNILNKKPRDVLTDKRFYLMLIIYAPVIVLQTVALDDWFDSHLPGFKPKSYLEIAVRLPWILTFQPLFLFAFQFALAYRLLRSPVTAICIIILFNELIAVQKLLGGSPELVFAGVSLSGLSACYLAVIYCYTGFWGLSIGSGICYLRFLFSG